MSASAVNPAAASPPARSPTACAASGTNCLVIAASQTWCVPSRKKPARPPRRCNRARMRYPVSGDGTTGMGTGNGILPTLASPSLMISPLRRHCSSYATCASTEPPQRGSPSTARRDGCGSSTSTTRPNASDRSARSMRTRTGSPGMAPATSTTIPSWRASMRPPAAAFSGTSVTMSSGRITGPRSVQGDGREAQTLPQDARLAALVRSRIRGGRHPRGERLEFGRRLAVRLGEEVGTGHLPCASDQAGVNQRQLRQHPLPRRRLARAARPDAWRRACARTRREPASQASGTSPVRRTSA